jgi:hypothetical protein
VPNLKSLFEGLTKICPEARAMLKEVCTRGPRGSA